MMLAIKDLPIYVATQPIDFRKAIDGLCMLISATFEQNPQQGLYVFYNKHHDKLKLLFWHHNGFVLFYKRLEKGKFFTKLSPNDKTITINEQQVQWLIAGLDWQLMSSYAPLEFQYYA